MHLAEPAPSDTIDPLSAGAAMPEGKAPARPARCEPQNVRRAGRDSLIAANGDMVFEAVAGQVNDLMPLAEAAIRTVRRAVSSPAPARDWRSSEGMRA
jgi:hypothetical protein